MDWRARAPLLITVSLTIMLAPLNSTMIVVALPAIISSLGVNLFEAGWLLTGYLVTMGALLPVGGKLGDRFGRRRLVIGGLVMFGLASLAASLAPNLPSLLFFRGLQAVAAALTFPNATAAVREALPAEHRASAFGLVGAGINLAAALGPLLGGILVTFGGWRSVFYANVPVIALALLVGWRSLPATRPAPSTRRLDVLGAVLLTALLVSLSAVIVFFGRAGAGGPVLVLAVVVLTVVFVRRELGHPDPVLQPRFFALRPFGSATAAVAFSNFAMYSTLVAVPLLLAPRGWRSADIGLVLMSFSVGSAIVAPLGGRLGDRFGRRAPALGGLALAAAALATLALGGGVSNVPLLLVTLALTGLGFGIASPSIQASAVESVPARDSGMAAGVYSSSRYLGSIVGTSLLAGAIAPSSIFAAVALAAGFALVAVLGLTGRGTRTQPPRRLEVSPSSSASVP